MMSAPNVTLNYFTEREGVLEVARIVNKIKCIWREIHNPDVGIDGQIEFLNQNGGATGHVIAVQIKSGASYMDVQDGVIRFYPEEKHRRYWENFPLPVMVVVYDPAKEQAYWEDARRFLRSDRGRETRCLLIPLSQTLDEAHRKALFTSSGAFDLPLLSIPQVLTRMLLAQNPNGGFPLSFFDLFVNGQTHLARKLFFSMRLCTELVDFRHTYMEWEFGSGMGSDDYDFLDAYIRFLVSQNLIVFDFSDYLTDWWKRELTPVFVCPLTSRGRELVEHIRQREDELRIWNGSDFNVRFSIACERSIGMFYLPSDGIRLPQIEHLKEAALTAHQADASK
jgi:hypothetical protein